MKERPILFSGEMVRAILEGRKTQTRRPVQPQPEWRDNILPGFGVCRNFHEKGDDCEADYYLKCPFGQVGDRLWVRETFTLTVPGNRPIYRESWKSQEGIMWTPSIHMPKWVSRITLEITEVRIQNIAEISNKDCVAEGIPCFPTDGPDYQKVRFFDLWDSLYAKKGFCWEANPWVWAITFKRIKP